MTPSKEIVWVTGGGTGIGQAVALLFARKGYRVAISGRRSEALQETLQIDPTLKDQLLAIPIDVSNPDDVDKALERICNQWGQVTILINNAGVLIHRSFRDSTLEDFQKSFNINCLSSIIILKKILPEWIKARHGTVVNISSILGKWASPGSPSYAASKFALTGFTESLRQELYASGIHVMGVYPGYIHTPMTDPYSSEFKKRYFGASPDSMAKAIYLGILHKKRDLYYPFYVSWMIKLSQLFPVPMEALRRWTGL